MKNLLVATLLVSSLTGCDQFQPSSEPAERFGSITALIDQDRWVSDLRPNSTIGAYDVESGYLLIFARHLDSAGFPSQLTLEVCTPPAVGSHQFANLWRGPYGPERLALGASANWLTPVRRTPPSPQDGYFATSYTSSGGSGDFLTIEVFDVERHEVRGSFRFHALSQTGKYELGAAGHFAGRIRMESHPLCPR